MLCIMVLNKNAYGVTIQEELESRMQRKTSRGALHTALTRLEEKGLISSDYGDPSPERGGRRKRYYEVTNKGLATLQEAKELRENMWQLIPKLS